VSTRTTAKTDGTEQLLVKQGPGSDLPGVFGVDPPDQPAPPTPVPEGVTTFPWSPDLEYIEQFRHQNELIRRVYDALTGRARPGKQTVELEPGVVRLMPTRLLVDTIILVGAAAGAAATLTVGTRVYNFAVQAFDTLVLPMALTIEQGAEVVTSDFRVYLIGWPTQAEGG